jgi:hypothetical protein
VSSEESEEKKKNRGVSQKLLNFVTKTSTSKYEALRTVGMLELNLLLTIQRKMNLIYCLQFPARLINRIPLEEIIPSLLENAKGSGYWYCQEVSLLLTRLQDKGNTIRPSCLQVGFKPTSIVNKKSAPHVTALLLRPEKEIKLPLIQMLANSKHCIR